ncbi:hypothetical protein [Georgenia sp. SUBG003]|uniref:hypothetical protein n=1 Tax=Georgenia sp. SUBG003 TaxID=1497974 RepID=UPI003AB13573
MLTRHLLVVGASMTDDNFLRLAHEVTAFRERDPPHGDDDGAPPIGTVVTLSPKPAQERLWEGRFRYLTMSDGATGASGPVTSRSSWTSSRCSPRAALRRCRRQPFGARRRRPGPPGARARSAGAAVGG